MLRQLEQQQVPLIPDLPYTQLRGHAAVIPFSLNSLTDMAAMFGGHRARDRYIQDYGFVALSRETIDTLAKLFGKGSVLEAGAGTGFLAQRLHERGVNVTASDFGDERAANFGFRKVYRRDHVGDSVDLLPGEFTHVLLAWPPYCDPFAARVAQAMVAGQVLVFQGEGPSGCTADGTFFEALEDASTWQPMPNWNTRLAKHHLQFTGIHDHWQVFRKLR